MNSPTGPSSLNEADELALDAFLSELHRPSKRPPDLSSQILQALAELPLNPATIASFADTLNASTDQVIGSQSIEVNVIPRSVKDSGEQLVVKRHSRWRSALVGLSLAASLAGIAAFSSRYWQADHKIAKQQAPSSLSAKQEPPLDHMAAQPKPVDPKHVPASPEERPASRNGIVLNQPSTDQSDVKQDRIAMTAEPGSNVSTPTSRVSVGAVATAMNRHLNEFWKRIGIEPTQTASDSEIATRIEARIGFRPNVVNGAIDQELFTSKEQAEPIATRLVSNLTDRLPLNAEMKQQMIGEASAAIAGGAAFDGLIANWVEQGRFAHGNQPQQTAELVAERLLNADVACARCHDSPVDSTLTQTDYWSFVACFKPTGQSNLFYELPDGRQRAADAAIPTRWSGIQDSDAATSQPPQPTPGGVASLLKNNSRLARSLANQVWETIYGAPLVSKSSDPLAPPRDDALQQMHIRLATAIQDARFDLRAAYRIALNSDSMKRTTPDLFSGDGWVTASEAQLAHEGARIRAFAAQAPAIAQLPRQQLLAAMSTKLGHDPLSIKNFDTLLAQPIMSPQASGSNSASVSTSRTAMSEQEQVWTQWLADRKAVEDSWLHWIKDPVQQRQHAFYAASLQPGPDAEQLAKQLQAEDKQGEDKADQSATANDRLMWVLIKGR